MVLELPQALSMSLCDQVIFERDTDKPTLVGLFTGIACDKFPSLSKPLDVFIALCNGRGKAPLDLQVIRLQTDEQINGQSVEVTFPHPLTVVNLRFRFRQLSFPEAGEYLFQLWCDGNPICHRRINVYLRENV